MSERVSGQLSIDIEQVMQEIRERIIAERGSTTVDGEPIIRMQGDHLPTAFYEHMYHAAME